MSPNELRANCSMVRYLEDAVDAADDGKPLPLPPAPRADRLITPTTEQIRRRRNCERAVKWKREQRMKERAHVTTIKES